MTRSEAIERAARALLADTEAERAACAAESGDPAVPPCEECARQLKRESALRAALSLPADPQGEEWDKIHVRYDEAVKEGFDRGWREAIEAAAAICGRMVVVGRAWTHDQEVAAHALLDAETAIRALAPPGAAEDAEAPRCPDALPTRHKPK